MYQMPLIACPQNNKEAINNHMDKKEWLGGLKFAIFVLVHT